MSKLSGSDVNPYAPPQAEVLGAEGFPPQPLLRPRSTKWAIFILLLKVVVIHWIHWGIIQESGFEGLWDAYAVQLGSLAAPVLSFIGLVMLIFTQLETNQTLHRLTPKAWAAEQRSLHQAQAKNCVASL